MADEGSFLPHLQDRGGPEEGGGVHSPHAVVLWGDGRESWHPTVQRYVEAHTVGVLQGARLEDSLARAFKEEGNRVFFCGDTQEGWTVLVIYCPTEVKSKGDIGKWLEYWIELLSGWGHGWVDTVVSPSEKYDPIVKMTATVIGANSILVRTGTVKAACQYQDHRDLREQLRRESTRLKGRGPHESETGSIPEETSESSTHGDQEKEQDSENEQPGGDLGGKNPEVSMVDVSNVAGSRRMMPQEEGEGEPSEDSDFEEETLNLPPPETITPRPATASARRLSWMLGRMEIKAEAAEKRDRNRVAGPPRKATAKRGKGVDWADEEHILPNNGPLPKEVLVVRQASGIRECRYVGEPWEIRGDGLILLTNNLLLSHNHTFHRNLQARAGGEYQRETAEALKGWGAEAESSQVPQ